MPTDIARLGIELDSSQVRKASADLAILQGRADAVQSRFRDFGRSAQRVGAMLTAGLTVPLLGAGALAVKTAADYETLQTQLEVLLGSAEQAEQVFGRLAEFAATTPFELGGIVKANNMLIGFGLTAEQTFQHLQTLGDIAAVSGGSLTDLARIFGQARAEGKLLTRDLRQLINQGVPIIGLLAESMGVTESAIFDMATAGEISFERLVDALEIATAAGGLFFGGMEKRSNTLSGIFSNLADSVNLALGDIGNTLIETLDIKDLTRDLIANIEAATDWFNNLSASAQRMILTFSGILIAAGPVIAILGTLSLAIGAISAPVAATVAAVAIGTAAIIDHWREVEAYFTTGGGAHMWTDLQELVKNTAGVITGIWGEFGDELILITKASFGAVASAVETSLSGINDLMAKFNGTFDDEINIFEDNIFTTLDKIDSKLVGFTTSFGSFLFNTFVSDPLKALGVMQTEAERSAEDAAEALKAAREQIFSELESREDTILAPSIDFDLDKIKRGVEVALAGMDRISEPVTVPADELIEIDWEQFEQELFIPFNLAEKILPPGSVGKLQERIAGLQEKIRFAFDRDVIADYQQEIRLLQDEINRLTGTGDQGFSGLHNTIMAIRGPMDNFLSSALTEMALFEEETRMVRNEFGELEEQTITLGDRLTDMFDKLLDQILQTIIQLKIIKPLMDSLFGTPTSTGVIDSLFGGAQQHKDALITKEGKVHTFHPDDNFVAFQGSMPMARPDVNIQINNFSGQQVEVQERSRPGGGLDVEVVVGNTVKGLFNNGKMDSTMSRNFNLSRRGRN